MKTNDVLHETYAALSANKARSGLTILGIVIGISSVIAMISIGSGVSNSITASIESLGSNLIMVTPGAQRGPGFQVSGGRGGAKSLKMDDAVAIQNEVYGVADVASEISGRYQVVAKGTNTNTSVDGVTSSYANIRNVQIDIGSWITDSQNTSIAKVAVLGPTTRDDLFGEGEDPTGQTIRIKGIEFKIIGVTTAKGGSGPTNADDMIYIPLMTAARYLSGNSYLTTIDVQASDSNQMTQIQEDITTLLLNRHRISDSTNADFSTMNQSDIISSMTSIVTTLTIFLGAIAGISLVVGGIGIMNMMLTTVTERTKEIGLRKAVGATQADIRLQFLVEAIMLTMIGGILGTGLGWLIAYGVSATGLVQTSVTFYSVALAVGVSAAIGIVFGYYPARRAASLNPIEALRYE